MPGFKKSERLKSQVLIDKLFSEGKSFSLPPFRVIYQMVDLQMEFPAQVLISVPRKNIKSAVIRNLVRRRIREIYRLNKQKFYNELSDLNRKCLFALIYTGKEVMKSSDFEPKIILILQRLIRDNDKAAG